MENVKTYTWNQLSDAISKLSPEQREQSVSFAVNSDTDTMLHQI